MFQSERLSVSHGFDLPCPAADCTDLFTAKGELAWIPAWTPTFVYPPSGATERGMVFTAELDGIVTVWTMTAHEPENGRVAYLRVTPGLRVVELTVSWRPAGADACRIEAHYVLTGLSEAGNTANSDYAAGFATMIDGWRDWLVGYFAKMA